jgi:toxin YoeB
VRKAAVGMRSSTRTVCTTWSNWIRIDRRRALRILKLIEAVLRDHFGGPGKPAPLRGQLAGAWSRRIDQEHRLVHIVEAASVRFIAARYHY